MPIAMTKISVRTFRRTVRPVIPLALALTFAACTSSTSSKSGKAGSGMVQHVVLCWLKEPGNEQARQSLIDATYRLSSIPGVVRAHAGPAVPSDRPMVDASFDVGIVIVLENTAALPAYLQHPTHKQLLATVLQPLTERVLIYDIVE